MSVKQPRAYERLWRDLLAGLLDSEVEGALATAAALRDVCARSNRAGWARFYAAQAAGLSHELHRRRKAWAAMEMDLQVPSGGSASSTEALWGEQPFPPVLEDDGADPPA